MTTITVELDRIKDLPALQALLDRLGLKYTIEDEWSGLTDAEIAGIEKGLKDVEAGRLHSESEVKEHLKKKISKLRFRDV